MKKGIIVFSAVIIAVTSYAQPEYKFFTRDEIVRMEQKRAIIETRYGDIKLRFFPRTAPNIANSFIRLSRLGYYNGKVFRNVIPGFIIQGNEHDAMERTKTQIRSGNPVYPLTSRLKAASHLKGSVAMVEREGSLTVGPQFMICVKDAQWLDGHYPVFGEVISGMAVVDEIADRTRDNLNTASSGISVRIVENENENN